MKTIDINLSIALPETLTEWESERIKAWLRSMEKVTNNKHLFSETTIGLHFGGITHLCPVPVVVAGLNLLKDTVE